jgi:mRNA interferase MazF
MMHYKDFSRWNQRKIELQLRKGPLHFHEGEIWWTSIGHNIGDEEDGKGNDFSRPVLILRKFNRNLFYGVPLSTTMREGRYYHSFTLAGGISTALLSHMRDYDARRLVTKKDTVEIKSLEEIRRLIRDLIA